MAMMFVVSAGTHILNRLAYMIHIYQIKIQQSFEDVFPTVLVKGPSINSMERSYYFCLYTGSMPLHRDISGL